MINIVRVMMDGFIFYPSHISGEELDEFLARGCYRMGQGVFTTHFIEQQDKIYRVYWLRYDLDRLTVSSGSRKILRLNRLFTVRHDSLQITPELEALYLAYKSGIDFEPAQSVRQWLLDNGEQNIFDTGMISIYQGNDMIAAGIFDKGANSIAGILNFYHPGFRKYSLGKYLMLLKIQESKEAGMRWYYPGYIVHGYPKFDYKLFAGKGAAELFLPELNEWLPYEDAMRIVESR